VKAPATPPVASVVVPAHNEEAVIARCLGALGQGLPPGTVEVVVACNGCRDRTADVARDAAAALPGLSVTVLEIDRGSKILALRAGDAAATAFPRVYLDADVELPGSSVLTVADRLGPGGGLAGRPPLIYDTVGASWPVRRYYAARGRNPALVGSLWGAGVYALSERGRARFGDWPEVVGDDLFVDGLFAADEVEIVPARPAVVRTPRDTASLVAILRRARRGARQGGSASTGGTLRGLAGSVVRRPWTLPDALVFTVLASVARLPQRSTTGAVWERDDSSRVSS
jgi:glycosyltransferase involved in cell wall biosynthesis